MHSDQLYAVTSSGAALYLILGDLAETDVGVSAHNIVSEPN
jgi:hypothetical protein